MNLQDFEINFREKVRSLDAGPDAKPKDAPDPAHDLSHFERVVATAKRLAQTENAKLEVVIPAAWLHDFIVVPKNDPRRTQASRLSAEAAIEYLRSIDYPAEFYEDISHAIEAHSFSANITARTLEARIVQDADRLDGIGAIGIARLFITAGLMRRPIYRSEDPFCKTTEPDDSIFTIDHIYKKLFVVAERLGTEAGRAEGAQRLAFLKIYLKELAREI